MEEGFILDALDLVRYHIILVKTSKGQVMSWIGQDFLSNNPDSCGVLKQLQMVPTRLPNPQVILQFNLEVPSGDCF